VTGRNLAAFIMAIAVVVISLPFLVKTDFGTTWSFPEVTTKNPYKPTEQMVCTTSGSAVLIGSNGETLKTPVALRAFRIVSLGIFQTESSETIKALRVTVSYKISGVGLKWETLVVILNIYGMTTTTGTQQKESRLTADTLTAEMPIEENTVEVVTRQTQLKEGARVTFDFGCTLVVKCTTESGVQLQNRTYEARFIFPTIYRTSIGGGVTQGGTTGTAPYKVVIQSRAPGVFSYTLLETCDATGKPKDTFAKEEAVYCNIKGRNNGQTADGAIIVIYDLDTAKEVQRFGTMVVSPGAEFSVLRAHLGPMPDRDWKLQFAMDTTATQFTVDTRGGSTTITTDSNQYATQLADDILNGRVPTGLSEKYLMYCIVYPGQK